MHCVYVLYIKFPTVFSFKINEDKPKYPTMKPVCALYLRISADELSIFSVSAAITQSTHGKWHLYTVQKFSITKYNKQLIQL